MVRWLEAGACSKAGMERQSEVARLSKPYINGPTFAKKQSAMIFGLLFSVCHVDLDSSSDP